eukprot:798224-Amphidinium_carterae.1
MRQIEKPEPEPSAKQPSKKQEQACLALRCKPNKYGTHANAAECSCLSTTMKLSSVVCKETAATTLVARIAEWLVMRRARVQLVPWPMVGKRTTRRGPSQRLSCRIKIKLPCQLSIAIERRLEPARTSVRTRDGCG